MMSAVLFWDLGGVVLSNGWDEHARAEAVRRFSLDAARFRAKASGTQPVNLKPGA